MTNTLHRFGAAESFSNDYVVFAMCCRGMNDQGALPKLKRFLEMAREFNPINLGDARHGGALRPSRSLNPMSHWTRDMRSDLDEVIAGLDTPTTVAAVFDTRESAEAFLAKVRTADLGLSINVSTSIDGAVGCCAAAGIPRHSVGYSLGFEGKTDKLPSDKVLMLSTMCGHGMVAGALAQKMMDWVREGRRTPEQAATYMARFCSCGIFNTARARGILEGVRG